MEGDYEIDDFGRDEAFLNVVLSLAQFLYQSYWRVEVSGVEHVPDQGRALLVSNHSGVLPFDGLMLGLALYNETPSQRLPRALADSWFPTLPFVSTLLQKTGQVQAHPLNALRLLERDELVAVFPEGTRGIGKPFRERYQLQRFGGSAGAAAGPALLSCDPHLALDRAAGVGAAAHQVVHRHRPAYPPGRLRHARSSQPVCGGPVDRPGAHYHPAHAAGAAGQAPLGFSGLAATQGHQSYT